MVTKTIKGKGYELDSHYKSLSGAKARAKDLDGRLHIFTGAITRTEITKIPKTKGHNALYAVWKRKE
jgi:hypothetical protein